MTRSRPMQAVDNVVSPLPTAMMNRSTVPFSRFLAVRRPALHPAAAVGRGRRAVGFVALALLAACQSTPPAPPEPPAATAAATPVAVEPAPPAAPPRPTLIDEQRRLAGLFRGTPVVFSMLSESRLQVDVPLRHSFDAGRSTVKAPLAAVLDRIAVSQAEGTSRLSISATSDRAAAVPARAASAGAAAGGGKAASAATARQERLASERRRSMTDYLMRKGLDASRIVAAPALPAGSTIRLLVEERPTP